MISVWTLSSVLWIGLAAQDMPAIAPVLGEEDMAVVRIDLARIDAARFAKSLLGAQADEPEIQGVTRLIAGAADALKKAGAKEIFVLLDLPTLPALPVVAVSVAPGDDGHKVIRLLQDGLNGLPIPFPDVHLIRGVVVAGPKDQLAKIRDARPAARPELIAALGVDDGSPVRVALSLSTTARRAIEESMPALPAEIGGGPIETLTNGVRWVTVSMAGDPKPQIRLTIQGKDASGAKAALGTLEKSLAALVEILRKQPGMGGLADAVAAFKPSVAGDRVTLDSDPAQIITLVSLPIRQVRESAKRSQSVNNLKQIGLAMHNYHSAMDSFPPAYNAAKDGKPLLSWRVHILPYLDQEALYKEFHLNEPWDSPHNKALIARMPLTYACPTADPKLAAEGKTTYLTPRGPRTIFPGAKGVKIQEITDGTSNTILAFDAPDANAVIWTKPDDWNVPEDGTPVPLPGHHPGSGNFSMADGSVRFFKNTIKPQTLKLLLTRNGGEVPPQDE